MTDNDIIDFIIAAEGSTYTDDPADRGGATKYGWTQKSLILVYARPVAKQEVMDLTEALARGLYQKYYLAPFTMVSPTELRWLLVDIAVQECSPLSMKAAVRYLQRALGVTVDGVIGGSTLTALGNTSQTWRKTFAEMVCERNLLYDALAIKRDQLKWLRGWDAQRINPFIKALV